MDWPHRPGGHASRAMAPVPPAILGRPSPPGISGAPLQGQRASLFSEATAAGLHELPHQLQKN